MVGEEAAVKLLVENNETGFQKKHVEAICSVGRSTKTKDQGYIGEKGIGFKSVFRVTSCPRIFSNGFQFSLPEKDDLSGLGYIVPWWIDKTPQGLDKKKTSIVLPLDKTEFSIDKVVQSLKDIAPETIIFLKKLKTIELSVDLEKSYEIIIEKDDSKYPLIRLTYLKKEGKKEIITEHLFWVMSKEFVKPDHINHEKRRDIKAREVSVAIPLEKNQRGKLFAYLPVWENIGMPFLVNADFLLVSSREGVKEDEPWNIWLRDCIPDVYVKALTSCLSSTDLPFEKRIAVYASLPRETNQKFLEPIIPEIQNTLKNTPCVYTAHQDWLAVPRTTRLAPNIFWELLGADAPPQALQKTIQLVRPELDPYRQKLRGIGVSSMTADDLILCLDDVDWLSLKDNKWLVQLYQYLKNNKIDDATLLSKKIVRIWSVEKQIGILSCDEEQPIYFERDGVARQAIKDVPDWLQKIVPVAFLEQDFLKFLSGQIGGTLKKWMTEQLNVHPFSLENYCIDILHVLQGQYESLSAKKIAEATAFLAAHADDEFDWDLIPVALSNGTKVIVSELISIR